jgi:hypothetical protein
VTSIVSNSDLFEFADIPNEDNTKSAVIEAEDSLRRFREMQEILDKPFLIDNDVSVLFAAEIMLPLDYNTRLRLDNKL